MSHWSAQNRRRPEAASSYGAPAPSPPRTSVQTTRPMQEPWRLVRCPQGCHMARMRVRRTPPKSDLPTNQVQCPPVRPFGSPSNPLADPRPATVSSQGFRLPAWARGQTAANAGGTRERLDGSGVRGEGCPAPSRSGRPRRPTAERGQPGVGRPCSIERSAARA
jgi:hypothetical protein